MRISSTLTHKIDKQNKQITKLKHRSEHEIKTLSPDFQHKVNIILTHLEGKGWIPVVFHGRRTKEEQAEKVKLGYSQTMKSFHVEGTVQHFGHNGLYGEKKGEAVDIVDARFLWDGPAKDLHYQFWKDLGGLAESLGLGWGGRWKKPDVAHVENTRIEISQDARGVRV